MAFAVGDQEVRAIIVILEIIRFFLPIFAEIACMDGEDLVGLFQTIVVVRIMT